MNSFQMVADACKKSGVEIVLIGGQALSAYGLHRMTLDIDWMILASDYEPLKQALSETGYREVAQTPVAAKLASTEDGAPDIDFLFVDSPTFKRIKEEGRQGSFSGCSLRIPKLEHMISMKLHSLKQQPQRELKDLADIIDLIRLNSVDARSESFKNLCLEFADPSIYKKILGYL